ncbi:MAG TPA: MFS transporter [Marinobacter sp.]|nr:MFS transporter [Marinobacter sp.]
MSSLSKNSPTGQNYASWFIIGLMASVTFVGILSELVPSGILPQMTEGLGIEQTQVGFLVGVYALASAIFAIPLISVTLWVNCKTLLLILLAGFTVSNIVVGLTTSYFLIVAMRIVGGICAGIMWPMIAAYGTYTYITLLVETINFLGGISLALLIFGIGSVVSVVLSAKIIDTYLRSLVVSMLACGAIAMALLVFFGTINGLSHLAFFLWGLAFGPLVTMYQTAVSKQVAHAKAVATAVQSSVFNFSIMMATWIGGLILVHMPGVGVSGIGYLSIVCFIPTMIIAFMAKKSLSS